MCTKFCCDYVISFSHLLIFFKVASVALGWLSLQVDTCKNTAKHSEMWTICLILQTFDVHVTVMYVYLSVCPMNLAIWGALLQLSSCLSDRYQFMHITWQGLTYSKYLTIPPEGYELWHPHNWPVTTTNHLPPHVANYLGHQRVSMFV